MLDWKVSTLDEIYEFASGLSKPRDQFGFGYPFLSFKDVFNNYIIPKDLSQLVNTTEKERRACSVKYGDVFLTRTSETQEELGISSVALKDYPNATFNGFTKRLRPKSNSEIDPKFAAYYFRSPKFRALITSMASMTTRASLNNEMLARLIISYPSFSEQQSIAEVLSSLDDKIDLLHHQNRTLEQMAETLFRQWFVEQTSDSFRVFKLIDIVKQIKPGTNYQPKRTTEGIPFLNVKNLINGFLNYSDINFITKEEYERVHKSWVPEENDLLISRIGTLGEVAVIMKRDLPVAVHYNMLNIKPKDTSHQFLYFLLKSKYFQEKYESIIRQSVQEYVAVDDVHQIDIFLPIGTSAFIKQEETFIAIFNKIEFNTNQIGVLSNLRDTILPRLMNGTLRVTSN